MRFGIGTGTDAAEAKSLPRAILLSVASSMVWALLAYELVVIAIVLAAGRSIRTGRTFESHIVREYSFRGGRIVRVRNFYDTAAYERSLG